MSLLLCQDYQCISTLQFNSVYKQQYLFFKVVILDPAYLYFLPTLSSTLFVNNEQHQSLVVNSTVVQNQMMVYSVYAITFNTMELMGAVGVTLQLQYTLVSPIIYHQTFNISLNLTLNDTSLMSDVPYVRSF